MPATRRPPAGQESVDLIDREDRTLGWARRNVVRSQNLLHRGVGILCRNSRAEIYVHQRTWTKDVFPGLYDMLVGGVVGRGESYEAAARREVAEELGIGESKLLPVGEHLYLGPLNRSLVRLFEVCWDGPIVHQEDEVAWGTYLTPQALDCRLADGDWRFVPDGLEIYEAVYRNRAHPPAG